VEERESAQSSDLRSDPVASRPARRLAWLEPVLLCLLALALNLAGNDRTGLWDRDEPRYAVCVREMRARANWVLPTFNGEPRYHKPPLVYWLMGLTTRLAGDNPFGARLVSGLAGASTVLGVWWLGRRMFGARGGWLAALVFATAPVVVAESKLATTDATLALWLFGCQACLWVLSRQPSRAAAIGFWLLLALATLTKGPVGIALVAASALVAWRCGWPIPSLARLEWRSGVALFLAVAVPWFAAVSIISRGEFLRFAVGNQIVHRVASDMEAHGGFPGYYPVVSLLAFYPWSALVPMALAGAWASRRSDPTLGFLIGWAIGPLLLLECFKTKLIHYYLPAIPACALLVTWVVVSISSEGVNIRRRPLGRLALALLLGLGLVATTVHLAVASIAPGSLRWPVVVIASVLAGGTLLGTLRFQHGETERAVLALGATWSVVLLLFCGWLIPQAEPYRTSRQIGERLARLSAQMGIKPVLLEYQEPGVIYALGHPVALTRDRDGFFAQLEGGKAVLTVALPSEIEVMRSHFGLHVTPVDEVYGFVLTKWREQLFQLAVVRRADSARDGVSPPGPTARAGPLKQSLVK
jgi:4-amino-4-deoxy-L-arabinose transferase-like glycosyltransferase